jgi:hypothetical protein
MKKLYKQLRNYNCYYYDLGGSCDFLSHGFSEYEKGFFIKLYDFNQFYVKYFCSMIKIYQSNKTKSLIIQYVLGV